MVSERSVAVSIVSGISIGLVLLVYGMWLSAGQSWNPPALAGGVVIIGFIAILTVRIANLEEPAH